MRHLDGRKAPADFGRIEDGQSGDLSEVTFGDVTSAESGRFGVR